MSTEEEEAKCDEFSENIDIKEEMYPIPQLLVSIETSEVRVQNEK